MGKSAQQTDGSHHDGCGLVAPKVDKCPHDKHGQEHGYAGHEHLHFRVAPCTCQFLVEMDGCVVIHGQLEDERKDHAGGKQQTSQSSHPRHLSLHDGHDREEERHYQHQALEIVFGLEQGEHRLFVHHKPVYIVSFGTHDGGEGHHSQAVEAIHADENAHKRKGVVNVGEGEQRAQHKHAAGSNEELFADNKVAHSGLDFKLKVFPDDAELVEKDHVARLERLHDLCFGDLHIDSHLLQTVVDIIERNYRQSKENKAKRIPLDEATHEANGSLKEPLVLFVEEKAEVYQQRINEQWNQDGGDVAIDECAPEQVPIAIEDEDEPPSQKKAYQPDNSIELRNCQKAEGNKEKSPKEIVGLQSHTAQERVQHETCWDVKQLVLLDVLSRSFLQEKTQQEVREQEPYHASVYPIERLKGSVLEEGVERYSKCTQVGSYKRYEDIAEELHHPILLEHWVATRLQTLIVGKRLI